jgi:peptidoglycan/LPS O-acetylase OafA/YrhL
LMTTYQHNSMALLVSPRFSQWIQSNYNFTFPFVLLNPNPMLLYMESLYLPLFGRYASFLIGSILALRLSNIQPRSSTKMDQMKRWIYFGLISFYFILLASPLPLPDDKQSRVDEIIVTIFISCSRQIFSISIAFLLFTALCPSTHPYSSSLMNKFLSLPLWSPIAKLSYLVYALHFRITFELIMDMKSFEFHRYAIGYSTLLHVAIVFILCLFLACPWHLLVEKPFERFINRILTGKSRRD